MKPCRVFFLLFMFVGFYVLMISCKKSETQPQPLYLSVDLPKSNLQHDVYYSLNYLERSIELDFSQPLDAATIEGNISFSCKSGISDSLYKVVSYGRKAIIAFQYGFQLQDGWRYQINITTGLRSTSGITLPTNTTIEIRTSTKHLFLSNDTSGRNAVVCISDIHMGDQRAITNGYCWFSKNASALESLLDMALHSAQVRQLVILGDLFDEWVVPYRMAPFDSANGITDSRMYFLSIASNPVNQQVISKLKAIASSGSIQLIYIPGNHDMLLTEEVLQEIIPDIIWQGDSKGLGHYSPLNEIIMEHGHRYDFFNCPQPLSNQGHMLPPGYFISRLDAEGLMEKGSSSHQMLKNGNGDVEFMAAWTAAYEYLKIHYNLTVAADSANIRMGGIDGYNNLLSFNGVRDMYAVNIEDVWLSTEVVNAMPVSMPALMAIVNGNTDLSFSAFYEYIGSAAPNRFKIVAFGHTHNPMLKVYPEGNQYTGIYANTGSWVNAEISSHPVRTFLVIRPGAWTGSDLDVVSLFQYNLDSGSGNPSPDYIPVLMAEESIANH